MPLELKRRSRRSRERNSANMVFKQKAAIDSSQGPQRGPVVVAAVVLIIQDFEQVLEGERNDMLVEVGT